MAFQNEWHFNVYQIPKIIYGLPLQEKIVMKRKIKKNSIRLKQINAKR